MLPTLGIGAGSCRSLGYIEQKSTGKKLAKEDEPVNDLELSTFDSLPENHKQEKSKEWRRH